MTAAEVQSPRTPQTHLKLDGSLSPRKRVNSNVHVICRVRPLSLFEYARSNRDVVNVVDSKTICIQDKDSSVFTYDRICGPDSTQDEVYSLVGKQTLSDLFQGYNGTILAYGQTGAGKSHTMFGRPSTGRQTGDGIIPRLCDKIFTKIAEGSEDIEYTVSVSLMEVYKEHIYDLLDPNSKGKEYSIHEDKVNGVYVKGLSHAFVSSSTEMAQVIKRGHRNRASSATDMNAESSRSHAIVQVMLVQKNIETGELRKSHLFLVDLAGSEKVDRTGASGNSLEEAKKINLSLSVLGLVINSLTDPRTSHIPYRDLKLTRILQESLGGNSRTSLIINISPASGCISETLSTLRFGSRAKKIRNSVHINTELSVEQLKARIALLEQSNRDLELELRNTKRPAATLSPDGIEQVQVASKSPMPAERPNFMLEEMQRKDDKIAQLEQEMLEMKMANLKSLHSEHLKLFRLESALLKLSDKLSDVELINENLRRHLLISEKIIEARDVKIEKLGQLLKEQQAQVNRDSMHFKSKLLMLKSKLEAQKLRELVLDSEDISFEADVSSTIESFLGDAGVGEQRQFNTPKQDYTDRFDIPSRELQLPISPKIGLNLRIVKPLRGGQSKPESESK